MPTAIERRRQTRQLLRTLRALIAMVNEVGQSTVWATRPPKSPHPGFRGTAHTFGANRPPNGRGRPSHLPSV